MFARYKKSMLRITSLLRSLEASLDDVTQLLALQRDLVRHIVRAERRIVVTRARRNDLQRQLKAGRLSKLESKKVRSRIAGVGDQISMYQQLMFIWRCFGDGIAFSYLDKFALKHAFLNTHDLERKQRAGAVSGKEGLKNEWKVVKALCSKPLPAMLSDITNIIRHGDVCLLGGPDPFPIEVKSSKNRHARVDRQLEHLEALHAFYENDTAENFRGLPGRLSRQEFKTPR